jgi:hypothetical protein
LEVKQLDDGIGDTFVLEGAWDEPRSHFMSATDRQQRETFAFYAMELTECDRGKFDARSGVIRPIPAKIHVSGDASPSFDTMSHLSIMPPESH